MSDTRNQRFSSSQPSGSGVRQPKKSPPDRNGMVKCPMVPDIVGDLVIEPSPWPAKISLDRKRVIPGARMLMAKPDTTWSTPNVTVAMACSNPPKAPNTRPPTRAAYGPQCQPAQPAPHVPRIIIPSRPMLTTPARSLNSPPRAASPIGAAAPTAAAKVSPAVRSGASGHDAGEGEHSDAEQGEHRRVGPTPATCPTAGLGARWPPERRAPPGARGDDGVDRGHQTTALAWPAARRRASAWSLAAASRTWAASA